MHAVWYKSVGHLEDVMFGSLTSEQGEPSEDELGEFVRKAMAEDFPEESEGSVCFANR